MLVKQPRRFGVVSLNLTKEDLRRRAAELREMVNRWDPIGVMSDPEWPRDEYECLVGPLLRRLEVRTAPDAIAKFLHHEVTQHFGLGIALAPCAAWAAEAVAWYEIRWSGTSGIPRADAP